MSRACVVEGCLNRGRKSICCEQKLCAYHEDRHVCPRAAELLAMSKAEARTFLAQEKNLRPQVIAGINASGLAHVTAVDAARGLTEPGFPDIAGRAPPDGRAVGIETKRSHSPGQRQKGECACASCQAQRKWAAAFEADGGVYVGNVRDLQSAIDGLRLGLARARGRQHEQQAALPDLSV